MLGRCVAAVAAVLAGPSWAADLRDLKPLQPVPFGLATSIGPSCTDRPERPPPRGLSLTVREADRTIGPYVVRLPGYSTQADGNTYVPPLIRVNPGDTLWIELRNQLTSEPDGSDEVNLHTHGLIAQPRRCAPFGDSVFVEDGPGRLARYAIAVPGTLPGAMFGAGGPDAPYPPGLNWLHAHVHGKARPDVMAGQSAILQVGDTKAALLAAARGHADEDDLLRRTDTVYLGLRDIQLAVPKGQTPDRAAPGTRAVWLDADYDPGICQNLADPPLPADPPAAPAPLGQVGWCTRPGATMNGAMLTDQDTAWLFTVNGQLSPTIRQRRGRAQLWNIVNLSSNVAYRLQLVADGAPDAPLDMQVVAVDGLFAGTAPPGSPGLHVGVPMKTLLLMPAGRAEVFVAPGAAAAGPLTLRTAGMLTGWPLTAAADPFPDGPQGDPWPAVGLAHVAGPPATAHPAGPEPLGPLAVERPRLLDVTLPTRAGSGPGAGAAAAPASPSAPPPANCIALPTDGTEARRHVVFDTDPSGAAFELASEVLRKDGTPLGGTSIPLQQFPHEAMADPGSVPHVCPRLGDMEVWELENHTTELHNFHIHQSKFRLARPTDRGAPTGMIPFQDPNGIVGHYAPGGGAEAMTDNSTVDLWHDTLPVPTAQFDRQGKMLAPGRIFVAIPFRAREQVGFFVFHCHILEHEDGGMMAVVQVFDPAAPQQAQAPGSAADFDRLAQASICRLPRQ